MLVFVALYSEDQVLLTSVVTFTPPSATKGIDTLPVTSVDTLNPVVVVVVVYMVDEVENVGLQVIAKVDCLLSQLAVSNTTKSASK